MAAAASGPDAGGIKRPLEGARLFAAAFVLALANFVVVLDMTIANVSVPHIAGGLAVSPTQGTWVITSYAVAEAIMLPLSGWIAQRFGTVRSFIGALIGFGIFSALCGLATSLTMLVAFRILQGLAGGPLMPLSQALLLQAFPKEKHPQAMTLWAMTTVLGPVAGPILGGVISDNWSWHWIFLINVPVTLLCGFFGWRMLRGQETPTRRVPIDFVGLVLLIVWVGALQLMLDKGRELDWFASPFIVILALVAATGFVAFLIWELTDENPVVALRVFKNRGFASAATAQSLAFGAYFASVVLVPLWLQTNLGYTGTWAGYATALTGVAGLMMAPVAARLLTRFDARMIVFIGTAWVGAMALLRTQWVTEITFWQAAMPQFVQGFGIPMFFIGVTTIALASVAPRDVASASGLMNFMRTLGGAVATASATTYWEHSQQESHAALAGVLNTPEAAARTFEAAGLSREQSLSMIDRLVTTESLTLATNHIFLVTTAIFALAAALIWLAPRPPRRVDPVAAH